jgi:hypothetical protein
MPAKDTYHNAVRNALIKDGWTITHDPLRLQWGRKDMFVDLGAERLIAAERAEERIAVEIKGFHGPSDMANIENAVGQYMVYQSFLRRLEPDRLLYLAVPDEIVRDVFEEPVGEVLLEDNLARVIGVNMEREEIVRWIP